MVDVVYPENRLGLLGRVFVSYEELAAQRTEAELRCLIAYKVNELQIQLTLNATDLQTRIHKRGNKRRGNFEWLSS